MVEAVLAARGDDPAAAQTACQALEAMVAAPDWNDVFTAYARCARITRSLDEQLALRPEVYQEQVEHDLHTAYDAALAALSAADEPATVLGAELTRLADPINAYFDAVLVNADDADLRQARLALVQHIAALPDRIADLSKLQGF